MKKPFFILLLIISIIPLLDLFHPGLPLTHDGKDHVARIANFYQNLQQGNIIPRWAGNLNWGYGHPILEFLYPLPSYTASVFHALGFSLIGATKIIFGLGFVGSGVAMYFWLAEFLPIPAAFIGGMLYMFTPYRFVELYVRGDIGENFAFIFMPLTLFFIYRIYKKQNGLPICLGAISFACLMLSHNAIVLMYFPFILFYCGYLFYQSKNKRYILRTTCYMLLLGFSLSAFFWIPALAEGKYTLRNIVTAGDYASRFVSFPQLLYGSWSYGGTGQFTVQLGIGNWVVVLLSCLGLCVLWKRKNKNVETIHELSLQIGLLTYTASAIFLMLPQSMFIWRKVMLLQNFQFPWRFLAIPLFTTSVLGAIVMSMVLKPHPDPLLKGEGMKKAMIFSIIVAVILFLNKDYWHAKGYLYKQDSFFTGIYDGTTDTGESSPVWSTRFMEHRVTHPLETFSGKATITQLQRTMMKHMYIVTATTPVSLRENTVYFPGWEVLDATRQVPIQYQDPHNRGLVTFALPEGKHVITVFYTETKLRLVSDMVSLCSSMLVLVILASVIFVDFAN